MLNRIKSLSIKQVLFMITSFIVSYISPIIGFLIMYMNKKNQMIRKSCIYGISVSMLLFVLNYIVFIIK